MSQVEIQDSRTRGSASSGINRRKWFDWHSIIGALGGLLLFVICWSGSFATVSSELDWLLNSAMRTEASDDNDPYFTDFNAIYRLVRQEMPDAYIRSVSRPESRHHAVDVVVMTADQQPLHVYVDWSATRIQGTAPWLTVSRFFRDFHMNFYGLFGAGKYLVCLFAIPLIGSLVTGLFFYKRWWRRFFELQTGRGARTFWSSAHKLAGIWAMWFVLVIGATGLWYLFEAVRHDFIDGKFAYADTFPLAVKQIPAQENNAKTQLESLEDVLKLVKDTRPDMNIYQITMDRGGYIYIVGQADHTLVRNRANKLFIDPVDKKIIYNQKANDLSAYWRWSNTADPLHFGNFGGLTSKIIWFVFGLVLSGLSLSGAWLHLKRLQKKRNGHAKRGTVSAIIISTAIVLVTVIQPFVRVLFFYGPEISGARHVPYLPPVTVGFILLWMIGTFAICLYWAKCFMLLQVREKS